MRVRMLLLTDGGSVHNPPALTRARAAVIETETQPPQGLPVARQRTFRLPLWALLFAFHLSQYTYFPLREEGRDEIHTLG